MSVDELNKKHDSEKKYVESQIKNLSKPKLGKKPLSAEQLAEQSTKLTTELRAKQDKEMAELIEQLASMPPISAPPAVEAAAADALATDSSAQLPQDGDSDDEDDDAQANVDGAGTSGPRKSKAQRRRERKEAEAKAARDAAAAPVVIGPTRRELEMLQFKKLLQPLGLDVRHIAADGHCLFRAVSDQLKIRAGPTASSAGSPAAVVPDYLALRKRAAEHIKMKWTDFHPFLPYEPADGYPESGAGNAAIQAAVGKYCERLANSGCWGGHPEIRALASSVGLPILVYQSDAPPMEFAPSGSESALASRGRAAAGDEDLSLRLSYHKQYLTLGEHYNSVFRLSKAGAN